MIYRERPSIMSDFGVGMRSKITIKQTQRCREGGGIQFLADKVTLFEPGRQIMPTALLPVPPQIFGRCGVSERNCKEVKIG